MRAKREGGGESSRFERVPGGFVDRSLDGASLGWDALIAESHAIVGLRVDGTALAVNDPMLDLLDCPIDEFEQRGFLASAHRDRDEQEAMRENLALLASAPGPRRHSLTLERGDGSQLVLDLVSAPTRLPDGTRGVFTFATDVTQRGTPIGAGRGYKELVEDAPDILTRVDVKTGRHLFVSRGVEPITGYTPEELYEDPHLYRRLLLPEHRAPLDAAVRAVLSGQPQWLMLEYRRKSGGTVSLHQALYPIRDASGRVVAIEGVARDMTAVRALERELQQTVTELRARNEELSSLDRLKSQLLANVSHELRTPLVTIKGYNELILRGTLGPVTPRQRRALEIASNSTERLVDLIESLLDFARLEEGRLTLRRSSIDARAAIQDAVDPYAKRIADKGLKLTLELGSAPLVVDADRGRLAQVVKALLSNAEKFCDAPGEISIRVERAGDRIALSVSDTGIGIPEAAQAKIFDRFYQVDSSMTRRFGGAGLGLALAREIVALHGGEIAVESVVGRGSTFTVRLPSAEAVTDVHAEDRPVLLIGAPPARGAEMRARLEAEGLVALDAQAGPEVLRRARRHRPDAVVLALDEDLIETIEALHADAETVHIPVIAMADDATREAALPLADYVVGEAEYPRLSEALRRLLGRDAGGAARPRVLVVDDEPEIVDFTRFVLERDGYEVAVATSGAGVFKEVDRAERPFDLVVLDIALEGLDGIEICKQLKAQPRTAHVPVLMITAMSGEEVRHGAFAAGADGFLVKPFGVDEFRRQVKLHLRSEAALPPASPGPDERSDRPGRR